LQESGFPDATTALATVAPVRILLVSWEYPPVLVGGLGRHVEALGRELAVAGHDVVVLSRRPTGTDATTHPTALEGDGPLRVLRVAEDPPLLEFGRDLVAWTLAWQHAAVRAALTCLRDWRPDVVHAHDWLAAHAGIALAEVHEVPLVATVHATEAGRNAGRLATPLQRQVHSAEWWLARRADALITCSAAMRDEVTALFGPSLAPIEVVHNGIAPREWAVDPARAAAARARWAPGGGPLLVNFGRLEYEKGVQDLLAALPLVRQRRPGTRLVVVGTGTQREMLAARARDHGVADDVAFAGRLSDTDLAAAVAAADAVVLPSRYEPFGIVALEAVAAGAPLVAARSGGLAEIVVDGVTGVSFPAGDVAALADAVGRVLDDPAAAARRAERGRARLATDFAWAGIAERTVGVYAGARCRPPVPLGRPTIPEGDVLAG
jgi:glycogen(starch) synthase